jgi:hypothetical protein
VSLILGRSIISSAHPTAFLWPYLANRGTDLRTMQDYLGHRDPRHTAHFTRVSGRRFEGGGSRRLKTLRGAPVLRPVHPGIMTSIEKDADISPGQHCREISDLSRSNP